MATPEDLQKHAASVAARRPEWGHGPWDGEPDRVEWRTAAGLPAIILRTQMGHLCGYVGVPPGHPLHGKDESDGACDVPCHGGLTYAGKCRGVVCHTPPPGEPEDVWWFGFDCAHSGDLVPSSAAHLTRSGFPRSSHEAYRDVRYVERECEALAEHLAALPFPTREARPLPTGAP